MPIGSKLNNKKSKSKDEDSSSSQLLQLIKELKWQKPSFELQYGKNLGLIGEPMTGKTLLALLIGYFNSEYKDMIRDAGYERVVKIMDAGLLPEVEQIMVLESENNLMKSLTTGVEKALMRPLIEKDILNIAPIIIPRKEVEITEDGASISMRRELWVEHVQLSHDRKTPVIDH